MKIVDGDQFRGGTGELVSAMDSPARAETKVSVNGK